MSGNENDAEPAEVDAKQGFTAEETIELHQAAHPPVAESEAASMITNVDENSEQAEKEEKKDVEKPAGRSIWISNLDTSTRAADLKALFTKYGRVQAAKIVTSAKSPGSKCYGFVQMGTPEEATLCIQNLHRSELHGRNISVERSKNDNVVPFKRAAAVKKVEKKEEEEEEEKNRSSSPGSEGSGGGEREEGDHSRERRPLSFRHRGYATNPNIQRRYRGRGQYMQTGGNMRGRLVGRLGGPPMRGRGLGFRGRAYQGNYGNRMQYQHNPMSRPGDRRSRIEDQIRFQEREREQQMIDRLRQSEIQRMQREETLILEREKAQLRAERERLARERLELQQMRFRGRGRGDFRQGGGDYRGPPASKPAYREERYERGGPPAFQPPRRRHHEEEAPRRLDEPRRLDKPRYSSGQGSSRDFSPPPFKQPRYEAAHRGGDDRYRSMGQQDARSSNYGGGGQGQYRDRRQGPPQQGNYYQGGGGGGGYRGRGGGFRGGFRGGGGMRY